jgi:hypothetical protein
MSVYANGLNIQMNEICFLKFMEQTQNSNEVATMIAVQYDVLKLMYDIIGQAIEQHDAGLNMVKSEGLGKGN